MKIITTNKAYVQKNDIMFLIQVDLSIPVSIFSKINKNGMFVVNDFNRYDFIEFNDDYEIEFFKNISWMVDYNEMKNLSEEEIINLGEEAVSEKAEIASRFNSLSEDEKENNSEMLKECNLLDFKIYSLRDILWYKQGLLKLKFPTELKKEYREELLIPESCFKRLLKRLSVSKSNI